MKKSYKKAISLAEIMIVVGIIAIITGIFLAMPKKNVAKTDKAKYYAAYNMLSSFQNGRLARYGTANLAIDNFNLNDEKDFNTSVDTWLNTTGIHTVSGNTAKVTLINGMTMKWTNNNTNINPRIVTIDLDGDSNGSCDDGKDCHNFNLYSEPRDKNPLLVTPDLANAGGFEDWAEFRVYTLNSSDGHKRFNDGGIMKASYNTAIETYQTCETATRFCFIEPIKPFK